MNGDRALTEENMTLAGKSVLITGGTGSFGKKCVEVLLREARLSRLVVFSRDEQKHVDMARHFFPPNRFPQIRYFIGDVRDLPRLKRALRDIDYVIHAAAMKHVDMAEYNPQECIRTNIGGTENIINACLDSGVRRVIALSTDKAANPINLYGATKLCADKLFIAANALGGERGTRFSVVRYGNVVGSKGSVIPFFLRQREKGRLPVTDPRMTRFWITLEEGVRVALMALTSMRGGEIFIPKIPSMNIMDLARAIGPECEIQHVGIRPGEKLHECLIPREEARYTLEFKDHFIIKPPFHDWVEEDVFEHVDAKNCVEDFVYSSDTNSEWLSIEQLREMIRPVEQELAGAASPPAVSEGSIP